MTFPRAVHQMSNLRESFLSQLMTTQSKTLFLSFFLLLFEPRLARAQSLGASISALPANPASTAFLQSNSASLAVSPISSNDVKIRYVGSDSISKKADSPLSFSDFQAGVAVKTNKRLSLGIGELLPPVSVELKVQEIPVVIFNTVGLVDLDIKAKVKYGVSFFAGYLINDRLSVGAGFSSRQVDANVVAKTSGNEELVDGEFKLQNSSLRLGLNLFLPANRLRIGVSTSLYSATSITSSLETGLVNDPNSKSLSNNTSASNLLFGDFLFGAEYIANANTAVFGDVIWRRSDKRQKEFSLVDLQEKSKDIHDTVSLFLSTRHRVEDRQYALAGFTYEPSSVGAGTKGSQGKSGFGMRETVMLYSGFGDLVPAWSISIGLQYGDPLPTISDVDKTNRRPRSKGQANLDEKKSTRIDFWERTTVSVSLRYKRSSLGVDSDGELPGAYSQTRLQFPVSIQSTF